MSLEDFHTAVTDGDFAKVKLLLSADSTLVNEVNESGMSPLHQACFRGHVDVVEYLLQNGADVNSKDQKQGYTALMFAAITGNRPLTKLLLQRGARINDTNKIGRTAAQMASFVGNQSVSTVINNFLEEYELEFYTRSTAPTKLRIHTNTARILYDLLLDINFTPVKIIMSLDSHLAGSHPPAVHRDAIIGEWRPVVKVLEDLLERYFVPHQTHEALALKFHLLACCVRKVGEYSEKHGLLDRTKYATSEQAPAGPTVSDLRGLVKEFLNGTDPHGLPGGQERFLRHILPSFPHHESTLWQYVVRQISQVQPGYSPTALSILEYAINGQTPFALSSDELSSQACSTCGDRGNNDSVIIKLCQNCKEVAYCSVNCQRLHWFTHKRYCSILKLHHHACEESQRMAAYKGTVK
ncbi:Ankyrin repeat and MYND domain-containing protein 2, variant 2 [Clonorchis sinensis]|uniref:Ankyrin repeat and MYND domain-containing protein 2 n=2 Tax=Clonorchis sinensis TaxID=79923 RepID=A0A8T1MME0_CLOSI|nr:Ankyrin repeat and MYND domain-containing protein 2 [Clonorchis sinensis]KAG5450251.1 Ankyrin repeat and MYND domain-containing protein 2, variant 2 [Clonorchis sinensis]